MLVRGSNPHLSFNHPLPTRQTDLTFKNQIKSHLPFAGIISSSPYSTGFQDKG